jgi:hypothetical protein
MPFPIDPIIAGRKIKDIKLPDFVYPEGNYNRKFPVLPNRDKNPALIVPL